ncbi:OmpA family protein [Cytophagaceae bacterium YF14B1]|uniref:OmpA family protein n=1 Tax=Xanthocytophaga flava TaxID=3048013 RepID=A0AAE3QK57_9BACT|nr:OmpA family protein [Xanthocytophaga flavus]MDJ1478970.1 OmpA family protein [Xanthocytophaga flavus]
MKVPHWRIVLPLLVFIQILFSHTSAQTITPKARLLYEQSQQYILERKFDQAVSALEKAIEREPNYPEAHFRLGNVYELKSQVEATENYADLSRQHYEKAIELKPGNPSFISAYSILGDYYLRKADYTKAKDYYQKFLDLKPPKQFQVTMAMQQIANCNFAAEAMQHPLAYKANAMTKELNKFALQYFPVLTADQQTVFFTARKGLDARSDENIYVAYRKGNEWTEPAPLSDRINTVENEGTCTISADGRTLVFTNCDGRQSFGSCDLYVSYKIGNEWTEPLNLGNKVNSPFWESQPSLSADGRTLYFTSDRRGGYGKRDIWVSKLGDDGLWGVASNLGTNINTPDDDLSPFIHVNAKTLFFSSKGHIGMGGFDLFSSELEGGKWSFAKNLGYPINNQDDQVSLFVSADGKKGYFAHEERQGRKYISSQLYEFDFPEEIAVKHKSNYLKGIVYDAKTKKSLEAKIELFNLNDGALEAVMKSDRKEGSYLTVLTEGASYGLYVDKEGYLFKSLYFDYSGTKNNEPVVLDIYLQPIEKGAKDILNNLFFETGKWELEGKSKTELDKLMALMKNTKGLRIEISGHTDDVGKDSDNLELSLKRAKSVYDYLINAGVEKNRLTYVGYGETQFAVPNNSEKNRQLNRRIEFKVL